MINEGMVRLWVGAGATSVSFLDMAHSLNLQWGTMHVGLCTLDGDGKTTMLAWGVCPAEDKEYYIRFLTDLKKKSAKFE